MRIDDLFDARQSRTSMVQGEVNVCEGQLLRTASGVSQEQVRVEAKGILAEGHQPTVGPKKRITAAQQVSKRRQLQTASGEGQEQVWCEGRAVRRDGCDYQGVLVAKEPSDKQPVNHLEVTASSGSYEQVTVEVQLTTSGPQLGGQPVYLCVKEAEFPQRNSVNPNILRLEANRVCTYISATEGRGD
jgi:hypothetical protein